ncbi:MAG: hypothetical protein ACR2L2_10845 [Acidobacteriota bacterium]
MYPRMGQSLAALALCGLATACHSASNSSSPIHRAVYAMVQEGQLASQENPATQPTTQPAEGQGQSALDRAVADLPTPAPDARQRDLASAKAGPANIRLIDVSLDVLAAGGGSTAKDSELQNLQGGGHDPRKNGFTLQNVELSFAGAVDPYVVGEAHLVFFIDPIVGESFFELEEAFLTTQQLPHGLQVEAGQFFTEFGRLNPRHPHQWEWMDQPIINTRLFGPDGTRGAGVRVGWLAPLPWFSEFHLGIQNANGETMASFLATGEFFEERPVGGRPFIEDDADAFSALVYLLRWENGFDLGDEWSAAVGVSSLYGPNATGPDGNTAIYGADLVMKWRPTRNERGWPYFLWQSEVMYRDYRADDAELDGIPIAGAILEDWGLYTQLLYGWTRGWRGGVRLDYASGSGESACDSENDPFRDDRYRVSPLVEWLPSEFSRVRLQYNYDHTEHLEDEDAHSIWLGFEYLVGAHAAHRY